jgi:hypothetical protein
MRTLILTPLVVLGAILTAFKKDFFGIEVKLSFQHAFYIKDLRGQMVRLQNICCIVTLPQQPLDKVQDTVPCRLYPHASVFFTRARTKGQA